MNKITRNITGLKRAAINKQLNTVARVMTAINQMIFTKQVITFAAVASFAKVSRTFLYKNVELRNKIEQHRGQYINKTNMKKSSDKAQEKLMKLTHHLKVLKNENKELKKKLELLYGELHLKQTAHDVNEKL